MWPHGSIPIKDYAIETPMKKPSEDDEFHEVRIDFNPSSAVETIHFVMRVCTSKIVSIFVFDVSNCLIHLSILLLDYILFHFEGLYACCRMKKLEPGISTKVEILRCRLRITSRGATFIYERFVRDQLIKYGVLRGHHHSKKKSVQFIVPKKD
ncbi:hypothetical protein HRI_003582400 [Hibiscus trionum]|uniref:Uncharacterized protein n=1 Tax=Hibiscus trionum TaxID=183268 RepID=A0A9W7IQ57_HIBTR|nr:hypothetical protein HRI_003582400 [Hibiscus trionum]